MWNRIQRVCLSAEGRVCLLGRRVQRRIKQTRVPNPALPLAVGLPHHHKRPEPVSFTCETGQYLLPRADMRLNKATHIPLATCSGQSGLPGRPYVTSCGKPGLPQLGGPSPMGDKVRRAWVTPRNHPRSVRH